MCTWVSNTEGKSLKQVVGQFAVERNKLLKDEQIN